MFQRLRYFGLLFLLTSNVTKQVLASYHVLTLLLIPFPTSTPHKFSLSQLDCERFGPKRNWSPLRPHEVCRRTLHRENHVCVLQRRRPVLLHKLNNKDSFSKLSCISSYKQQLFHSFKQSVLRQVQSLFHSELSTQCDPELPPSNERVSSPFLNVIQQLPTTSSLSSCHFYPPLYLSFNNTLQKAVSTQNVTNPVRLPITYFMQDTPLLFDSQ